MGEPLRRCTACGGWEYGGAPSCARCAALVDDIVEDAWREFLTRMLGTRPGVQGAGAGELDARGAGGHVPGAGSTGAAGDGRTAGDERAVAEMVAEEPDRHDWRVFDAALDRLTCDDCGDRLGRGLAGCPGCDLAHGFRYAAIETDRSGVPPGNEHAIRVNVSVVRRPHGISAPELLGRSLFLPFLLAGALPTTRQAQRMSALLKSGVTREEVAALVDAVSAEFSR
ncbi:hypothetical protein GCM10023194_76740 [Planotetraspora phitsanulokensis]|uniref:Uncharacterized protein n=1 Tax=Planotetraspora phitsanulokensis TaxID=575192 RepID=A0A8J3TZ85_9ACTN|nr:hypothetical protein Pph01_04910 [Planotetraspora phitsanulokensis]